MHHRYFLFIITTSYFRCTKIKKNCIFLYYILRCLYYWFLLLNLCNKIDFCQIIIIIIIKKIQRERVLY